MSAKLYALKYLINYQMITIANSEEEAKLIFKNYFNKEATEIAIYNKTCIVSLGMTCDTCESGNHYCYCANTICTNLPQKDGFYIS